jgi:DNA-binding NtrC family response regulator
MPISLLVADDEKPSHELLDLTIAGWREGEVKVRHAYSPAEAIAAMEKDSVHLALIDLHYGPGPAQGFALVKRLKEIDPQVEVIVVSSAGGFEDVQAAMRAGAHDYVAKGFSRAELTHALERALERRRWKKLEKRVLGMGFALVGGSPATEKLKSELRKVAPKGAPVLLEGETGSGKEVAARALHQWGIDPAGPFVAVNCGAVPASTADSFFFGHERGAFTGAEKSREGVFEEADGGTLFLDEINSLSLDLQARLLRVLQENEIRRLGGSRNIAVQFRLVAATNAPLPKLVAEGKFREDLFYRINVVLVRVPPLRERLSDIPLLANFFLPERSLHPSVLTAFGEYHWPGNVREFRNALLAMDALASPGEELTLEHLPEQSLRSLAGDVGGLSAFTLSQEEREKEFLQKTYRGCAGNVSKMARLLGLDRSHLHQKLTKLKIHQARA